MNSAERLFLLFTFVILFAQAASANLGQNPKQVGTRYGAGKSILAETPAEDAQVYSFKGLFILVEYWKGVSSSEQYQKHGGAALAEAEINALLAANTGAASWRQTPSDTWVRTDKAAIAYLADHGKALVVQLYDYHVEERKNQEQPGAQ